MRKEINLETWDRKDVYAFFKDMQIPVCSVTSEVDCTETFVFCKNNKVAYSKLCSYASLRAVNEIRELRYRIEDGGKTIAEYDRIDLCAPIKINASYRFTSITVQYDKDFLAFYKSMQ